MKTTDKETIQQLIDSLGMSNVLRYVIAAVPESDEFYLRNLRADLTNTLVNYEGNCGGEEAPCLVEHYDDFGAPC